MRVKSRILYMTLVIIGALALAGCGGGGSAAPPPTQTPTQTQSQTTYTVTGNAGTGGAIAPTNATVDAGGTTTFTITPGSGYAISSVSGCGGNLSGSTYTTGAISANCTVTADFVAVYKVSTSASTGGSISPTSAQVNSGGTSQFTVTSNAGYVVNSVSGCGGKLSGSNYTTGAITADCTVTVSFTAVFTWISGSDAPDASGSFGTQGVPAASNAPGARDGADSWADTQGNLWLFGGEQTNNGNYYNDFWEYSPASGEWTWMGGSQTANASGIYGTLEVAAASNMPGARYVGASWVDTNGNLWLFGGLGYDSSGIFGSLNDLWEYSAAGGKWTWESGSNVANVGGTYGTQGVAETTNVPGARAAAVTWRDASGNLWLFGGLGYDSMRNYGYLNDLWEYSVASGKWAWEGGSELGDVGGMYGTQGVAKTTNAPGGRFGAISWTDASGNLWLFGGYGCDSTSTTCSNPGFLNDLWEYSPAGGTWTWVSGSDTANAPGVYGSEGTAAAGNVAGARYGAVGWTDTSGNLWVFGGVGCDSTSACSAQGYLNDLWEYSPTTGEWTWVSGSETADATGTYGTLGSGAILNIPGARFNAAAWTDSKGEIWIFGGFGVSNVANTIGDLSDLWEYPNP